jgi:murein DD-endopeptidase MepM/ murein hydrolase activator NlpD
VRKTKFPFVSFWLKPAKKKLFTGDLIAREWARIEKTLLVEFERQRWRGLFTLPAKGPTSMVFGTIERVNGRRTGQHRGLDIAVPMGTKIKAPNHGRVVFAEHLKAFGGTIVLDHGQGVHTLYFHLSKFLAKVGQEVSKGDIIALSGNSGISSGPHLHWGMSVHNLRVDPGQWTRMAF